MDRCNKQEKAKRRRHKVENENQDYVLSDEETINEDFSIEKINEILNDSHDSENDEEKQGQERSQNRLQEYVESTAQEREKAPRPIVDRENEASGALVYSLDKDFDELVDRDPTT